MWLTQESDNQGSESSYHFGRDMEARAPAHTPAALQDLDRGRRLKVAETLGYAVRKGAELGISLPTIDTCYRLIVGINRSLQGGDA